jgi:hypothetical protein
MLRLKVRQRCGASQICIRSFAVIRFYGMPNAISAPALLCYSRSVEVRFVGLLCTLANLGVAAVLEQHRVDKQRDINIKRGVELRGVNTEMV